MVTVQQIADDLGGIPALADACGVQYRLAYGYVARNSLPATKDIRVVEALKSAGSSISLVDIAKARDARPQNDDGYHKDREQDHSRAVSSNCSEQDTNATQPDDEAA